MGTINEYKNRFNQLLKSKLGNVKPLVNEQKYEYDPMYDEIENTNVMPTLSPKELITKSLPSELSFLPNDDLNQNEKEGPQVGKKTITKSSYIIQLGDPRSKEFNVVWGGIPSAKYGASFMKAQGDSYLGDKNVIYSDWENGISTLKEKLKMELGDGYVIRSVSGFSKGSEAIFKNWSTFSTYDFIGLIDPSTYGSPSSGPTLTNSTKCISNHTNWTCCSKVKKDLMMLEGNTENGCIRITNPSKPYNHDDMPKTFFEKYSSNY